MLDNILVSHFHNYPKMQPQDAVKLIYQNEFGASHMLRDQKKARALLHEEMSTLLPNAKQPLYEMIGNGLCRLNLAACVARHIDENLVFQLFVDAAAHTHGEKRSFYEKLRVLEELAEADETPFDPIDLDIFLMHYKDRGCPAVHHSVEYQIAYAPAYRLVLQKQLKDALAALRNE